MLGCGNSTLSADMAQDGYTQITSMCGDVTDRLFRKHS